MTVQVENTETVEQTKAEATPETESDQENELAVNQTDKGQNESLPEGVSLKRKDNEHMDLSIVMDPVSISKVYLPVSDDAGDLLGDKELEKEAIECIDRNKNIDLTKVENLDALIVEVMNVSIRYTGRINLTDSILSGTISKCRIRQGMLCNILKPLVIKNGLYWIPWFNKHFNPKTLRSVEVYMSIAAIPNVIRYSFLDLERLNEIQRAIKGYAATDVDPIGTFLKENKIPIDFESDDAIEDFKIDIDVAITNKKIKKSAKAQGVELNVDLKLLRKIMAKGKNANIGDMVIVAQSGGDVNKHLKDWYRNNGKKSSAVESVKTVKGFVKLVAEIKSSVKFIEDFPELNIQIEKKYIKDLETQIATLKKLQRAKTKKE